MVQLYVLIGDGYMVCVYFLKIWFLGFLDYEVFSP